MAQDESRRDSQAEEQRTDRVQQIRARAWAAYDLAVREAAIMQHIDARRSTIRRRTPAGRDVR
jgi:hypothetical protein